MARAAQSAMRVRGKRGDPLEHPRGRTIVHAIPERGEQSSEPMGAPSGCSASVVGSCTAHTSGMCAVLVR